MAKKSLARHLAGDKEVRGQAEQIVAETKKLFSAAKGESSQFNGINKTYTPLRDGGLMIEPVTKEVVTTVPERLDYTFKMMERLFDFLVTRDKANTQAFANIEIDGNIIAADVPIDTIIEGQKILTKLRDDILRMLPTLDMSYKWEKDRAGIWKRGPVETYRTEKQVRGVELAKATEKHPAQIERVSEDVAVGKFNAVYFSGLTTPKVMHELLEECEKLIRAFKEAQTKANEVEVTDIKIGSVILNRFREVVAKNS